MPPQRQHPADAHPALGVLRQRRITNRKVAELLNLTPGWVGAILLGNVPAPASFRSGVAALLGLPLHELFHDEAPRPRHPGDSALSVGS